MTKSSKPNVLEYSSLGEFLLAFVSYSKMRNKNWSYNVWARKLGLSSKSSLIMIVQGKRSPGAQLIERMVAYLELSDEEKVYFRHLVSRAKIPNVEKVQFVPDENEGKQSSFRYWLKFVLKDLSKTQDFTHDAKWIQKKLFLQFSDIEIESALNELHIEQSGPMAPQEKTMSFNDIVQFHRDSADASTQALLRCPREQRVFNTSILRISPDKISEAQILLKEFQSNLSVLLENERGQAVYELHLHLFPVSKNSNEPT